MKSRRAVSRANVPAVPAMLAVLVSAACAGLPPDTVQPAGTADVHRAFLANLAQQCGLAFRGEVLDVPPDDVGFAGDPALIMHIRECSPDEVRIPVFVGDDRSRMWIFTHTGGGIDLRHDHRHEDGRSEPTTFYGAFVSDTPIALQPPSATRHEFKRVQNELNSGWVVEILPGERYTYGNHEDRRTHLQAVDGT
jgi:hypothetical protein